MTENIEECLKQFIVHVDNLGREDEPGGDGFWREFKELREIQIANKSENKYPSEEGKKECNIKKNRYKDILPFDYRRVVLSKQDGVEGSDYINASFIQDVYGKNGYIASQGPLPHTVNDFWRMLWEYKVEIVFMVCREEESGRPKCERYWALEGEAKMFGHLEVTLESEKELFPDFVERILRVVHGGEKHVVKQFHYTGWPDHGVPHHSQEIYKMVGKMREARRLLEIPIVIHCSAGCGRTGTICAVDYAWTLLDQNKVSHGFSLYEVIKNIRQQRQSMVQTPDQYEFAHLVVQSLCEDWINLFQEHDYYNAEVIPPAQDDEQIYYNTAAELASIPSPTSPPSTPTHTEGSRKPQPLPRPTLDVKSGGDKYENVVIRAPSVKGPKKPLRAVSDTGHAYDNQKPITTDPKTSAVSKTASLPTPLKQTSPKTQEKLPRTQAAPTTRPNISGTNSLPKAGHSTTVNVSGAQVATKKTFAPQPPTTQVNAHKAGVLNLGHVGGQPQVAANRKLPTEVTNGQADVYGEVVKTPGKVGSSPDVSHKTFQHGQKKRGGAVKKVMHKAESNQSYENFPLPGRRCESYENFPLFMRQEPSTSGPDKQLDDGAPELPSRGYSEEEASTDLFPPPSSGFGTVGALGGVVSPARSRLDSSGASSSSRTLDSSSSHSPVIRSVASSVESVYSEISNVQQPPTRTEVSSANRAPNQQQFQTQNHTSVGATSRSPFGVMKDMFNIRNPRSGVQVVQAVPGVYRFRGQDVGFANRPQKPKGKKEEPRYWKTYM